MRLKNKAAIVAKFQQRVQPFPIATAANDRVGQQRQQQNQQEWQRITSAACEAVDKRQQFLLVLPVCST